MGTLLQLVSIAGGLGLIAFIFFPGDRSTMATGWWSVVEAVLFIVALLGALGFLAFLLDRGERHLVRSGPEALRGDPRPPVLYLRPFEAETGMTVAERVLARILDQEVGPLVAVGNPGDKLPQLGAARFYERDFADDDRDWQLFVREMLLRARLVLIAPGRTIGLAWEVAQCREALDPQRLIVLVGGSAQRFGEFRSIAAQAGLVLPEIAARDFGWGAESDVIGIVTFNPDWTAHFTAFAPQSPFERFGAEEQEQRLRQALAPIVEQLGGRG